MPKFPAGRKKGRMPYVIMILLMVVMAAMRNQKVVEERDAVKSNFREQFIGGAATLLEGFYSPVLKYAQNTKEEISFVNFVENLIFSPVPVLAYAEEDTCMEYTYENESTKKLLMALERKETKKTQITESVSGNSELLVQEDQIAQMELENKEVQPVFQIQKEKQHFYDWASLTDYQSLMENFYIVDAGTEVSAEQINYPALTNPDMSIEVNPEVPQILIYHTHSNETFADSISGDDNTSIIGVGAKLAETLRTYGYNVLHHTAEYDAVRDDAYGVALPEMEKLLQENPSIEVVIDLHRDSVADDRRLVTDIQGRPTAQIMFFNGLSRIKGRGEIDYLENSNIADNLAFSFQMQVAMNEYYPGLTRKIYLKGYRYNMHLKPKYLLVEMGAQNNTVEEMKNACDPLAHILYLVLTGQSR